MIDLSPKRQFMKLRKEESERFAEIVSQAAFGTALTYAFAEFAQSGITTEELNGAKKFLLVLGSLNDEQEDRKMPQKSLKEL